LRVFSCAVVKLEGVVIEVEADYTIEPPGQNCSQVSYFAQHVEENAHTCPGTA
jgi:hypothetical protein